VGHATQRRGHFDVGWRRVWELNICIQVGEVPEITIVVNVRRARAKAPNAAAEDTLAQVAGGGEQGCTPEWVGAKSGVAYVSIHYTNGWAIIYALVEIVIIEPKEHTSGDPSLTNERGDIPSDRRSEWSIRVVVSAYAQGGDEVRRKLGWRPDRWVWWQFIEA
jgi:hypothetical protein